MANTGKVLIVGAGLSGLALAQCLRRQSIPFEVFESDASPDTRSQSWTILLRECLTGLNHLFPSDMPPLESSVSPLRNLSSSDVALATSNKTHSSTNFCAIHYSTGEQLDKYISSDAADPVHRFMRANRAGFRTWLMSGVEVQWDKRFTRYEETPSGVTAHFADGTSAEGSILVAADGARSAVRTELLGAEKCTLQAAPIEAISANMTLKRDEYAELLGKGSTAVMSNCQKFHFFIGPRGFDAEREIGEYYWFVSLDGNSDPSTSSTDASQDPQEKEQLSRVALQKALSITETLHPSLRKYVERTNPSEVLSTSSALMQWSPPDTTLPQSKRVILLGDALHAMIPFRGGGANTALLDAYDLSQLIGQAVAVGKDFSEVKGVYEGIAVPRGQGMVEFSRSSGTSSDPTFWAKMARKLTDDGFEWKELERMI